MNHIKSENELYLLFLFSVDQNHLIICIEMHIEYMHKTKQYPASVRKCHLYKMSHFNLRRNFENINIDHTPLKVERRFNAKAVQCELI